MSDSATMIPLDNVDPALVEELLDRAFEPERHARTAYKVREGADWLPALSFAALDATERALAPALAAEDFAAAMTSLAHLREPIDAFFETTVVNADSPTIRRNRLCLLNRIRTVMNRVAVFSALEG